MSKSNKVLIKSMFVNTFLIIIKIIVGVIGKSKTLIADGIHSLSDLTTDVVAIIGNTMSKKPADDNHPYGHGKLQYLTSIGVGIIILVLGIGIIGSAWTIKTSIPSSIVLYVSVITFVLKLSFSQYIINKGKKYHNSILIASGYESRSDALTPLFVIASYFLTKLTKYNTIFRYSDNFFTIVIGIYILSVAYNILKTNILSIIGKVEDDSEYLDSIKNIIMNNKKVLKINDLTILQYGSYYVANIVIMLDPNTKLSEIEKITDSLSKKICNKKTRILYVKISPTSKE